MANQGRVQLLFIAFAPADLADEGRRLWRSHAKWMEATHHREGDKALISYDLSSAPEPTDVWDPDAGSTGRTMFLLNEIYESEAGVADHQEQARESWDEWEAFVAWMQKCEVHGVSSAVIDHSLW